MSEEPQKQHASTLDWPIWIQVILTLGLIVGLGFALHVSKQNNVAPESDDVAFAQKADGEDDPQPKPIEPPKEVTLAPPNTEWQDKRVLATSAEIAQLIANEGAKVSCYNAPAEGLATVTSDQLTEADPFDVIVVTELASRPPKDLARKVQKEGQLFILQEDGSWREYRENAGMLRSADQR